MPVKSILTPRASSKSADPDFDDAARLPCFTTRAPAAFVIIAAVVEMLIVLAPSPPVPTVSTALSVMLIGAQYLYICATNASTSCALSPFAFNPMRKALISSLLAAPSKICDIPQVTWSLDKSFLSVNAAKISLQPIATSYYLASAE